MSLININHISHIKDSKLNQNNQINKQGVTPNIIPSTSKKFAGKKIVQTVANVPIDKVSFYLPENAQRWKYIYHRRLALERELGKEALEIKVVMQLIKEAGLIMTVCNLGDCYEKLVKEFLVNIPDECDNPLSREYQKVFVRGECVNFFVLLVCPVSWCLIFSIY